MMRTAVWFGLTLASACLAQTVPPDYGHDFVTIGAPGNRGVTPAEAPLWRFDRFGTFGGVDYEFRITRTEVTNTQYLEFLNVYTKLPGHRSTFFMAGSGIFNDGFDPHGHAILRIFSGAEQAPANPSWEFAARYVNWLHNDKGTRLEDFERGVYDTSTFGIDPVTGKRTDQLERSPGSRFFLPTFDEWTKAAHYDPNRYGEDQEGYWYFPGASDDPLVSGMPGEPGAETGVGQTPPEFWFAFHAGSFPGTDGPWGLLDTSGGAMEWTESVLDQGFDDRTRILVGSQTIDPFGFLSSDRLDDITLGLWEPHGFRIASVVPAPGVATAVIAGFCVVCWRHRSVA
ncbi:MAG: SUMF1/EgtB/PvdO family nonheme iron enzyme [Phycisphaeraceae bacterium]|nr:SUMF1/EgtB/PvdO family nonheme iron enzyme [Phycisphaeraceae bacterium]